MCVTKTNLMTIHVGWSFVKMRTAFIAVWLKKTFIFDIQINSDEYILLIEESLKEPPIICEDEGSIHIGILIKISLIDNETN